MDINAQIYRSTEVDDALVNQYADELKRLAKLAGVDKAVGFSRSVTIKKGEVYETTIIFYQDKDGEMHDRIVKARLLSYGDKGKVDTTTKGEQLTTDSLSFKAKSVTKSKSGYLVVGNVSDKGVEIPVVLTTAPPDPKPEPEPMRLPEKRPLRFAKNGNPFNANGRVVGCMFKCIDSADVLLIKLIRNDHVNNFFGQLDDQCYSESFLVSVSWWNGGRSGMSWERQVELMRKEYKFD
jgi:hypothetical protein